MEAILQPRYPTGLGIILENRFQLNYPTGLDIILEAILQRRYTADLGTFMETVLIAAKVHYRFGHCPRN